MYSDHKMRWNQIVCLCSSKTKDMKKMELKRTS